MRGRGREKSERLFFLDKRVRRWKTQARKQKKQLARRRREDERTKKFEDRKWEKRSFSVAFLMSAGEPQRPAAVSEVQKKKKKRQHTRISVFLFRAMLHTFLMPITAPWFLVLRGTTSAEREIGAPNDEAHHLTLLGLELRRQRRDAAPLLLEEQTALHQTLSSFFVLFFFHVLRGNNKVLQNRAIITGQHTHSQHITPSRCTRCGGCITTRRRKKG